MSQQARAPETRSVVGHRDLTLSLEEAATVFDDPPFITVIDEEHSVEQERYITIGLSQHGRLLLVAHHLAREECYDAWPILSGTTIILMWTLLSRCA